MSNDQLTLIDNFQNLQKLHSVINEINKLVNEREVTYSNLNLLVLQLHTLAVDLTTGHEKMCHLLEDYANGRK